MAGKLYNFDVARTEKQLKQMEDLEKRGVCVFCPEHFKREHREPIALETPHWLVTENDYPYKDTKHHLLLVPKTHVNTFSKLSQVAQHDFANVITKVEKHWKLTSYSLGMRSGDMNFNGGSVEHMHAHIVVGNTENPNHEPVRFKMSSRPK